MAKQLHEVTEDEIQKLVAMSEADAKAAINALDLSFPDATMLKAKIAGLRVAKARPASSDVVEEIAMAAGVTGVTTAAVMSRVGDLLSGKTMRYEAFLNLEELIGRLRTLLGDKYRIIRLDALSIALNSLKDGARLCEVRLAPEDNRSVTAVTISRPNTDKAKDAAGDLASEALRRVTRPGGFSLNSLLDMGRRAAETALDTASDLTEMNAVVNIIEDYGVAAEQALATQRRKEKAEAEDNARREYLKTHCAFCDSSFAEGTTKCPNCGASVG